MNPFLRYRSDVRLIDRDGLERGDLERDQCLFIFSPLTWLGENAARSWFSVMSPGRGIYYEAVVTLVREGAAWNVRAIDGGWQR